MVMKFMYVRCFFVKKDAKKYLETLSNKHFYEVVGVTIDKSKIDNHKKR